MVMKRNIRAAKAAAALLVGASVLGMQLPVVQAADSQGLTGSYIGIGTAPEESKVFKKGQEVIEDETGVADYRSVSHIGTVGDNADGQGVAWTRDKETLGVFAGGYGAYAMSNYSTALGTYAAAEMGIPLSVRVPMQ